MTTSDWGSKTAIPGNLKPQNAIKNKNCSWPEKCVFNNIHSAKSYLICFNNLTKSFQWYFLDHWHFLHLGLCLDLDQTKRVTCYIGMLKRVKSALNQFWLKNIYKFKVFDPFTELFITLCIAVNVIFMAMDHYNTEYDGMWVIIGKKTIMFYTIADKRTKCLINLDFHKSMEILFRC